MSKWENVDAGPRMTAAVDKALRDVTWEGKTFVELTGTIGDEASESRHTYTRMIGGGLRADVVEGLAAIGERFAWQVTKTNYRDIIAACEDLVAEAKDRRPVDDQRITPEERSERDAATAERVAAETARRTADTAIRDQVTAAMPPGARALIVAEYHVDTSDPMTDYFANRTDRAVAIGWRFSAREDFRALRAAAASFPETAHLGSPEALAAWALELDSGDENGGRSRFIRTNGRVELEHRDNYSMGRGNYLSDHGWDGSGTGWVVRSERVDSSWWRVTEIHLPDPVATAAATTSAEGVTVRPSSIGRAGVVEVVFSAKPSEQVRAGLKAHGFRWAKSNGCWYGRDQAYARSLAGEPAPEAGHAPDIDLVNGY